MKKIMIAIGAVAFAFGVQAASVNWSIECATDPNSGDDMGDGNTYYAFFFADSTTAGGASATYLRSAAIAALSSGDATFIDKAIGDITEFDYGEAVGNGFGSFNNSNTVNAYAVILDANNAADATIAYITAIGSTDINSIGGAERIEFGDISAATADINNWYSLSSSVPEPTSGLLLLLGVAGLALKRKRM